jgi:Toprim domain
MPLPSHRLSAAELARRLAPQAFAICRRCLSNGRREGALWRVGDLGNTPGRSMFVRLTGPRAGRWADMATGDYGDLLDLIAATETQGDLRAAIGVALDLLNLTALSRSADVPPSPALSADASRDAAAADTVALARRLWARCRPIAGTLAETYLKSRSVPGPFDDLPLRFHPALPWRPHAEAPFARHPALVAAVTDEHGRLTGVHRTWLDPDGVKARIAEPRRSLGRLLGNAVRFPALEPSHEPMALLAGEGLETVLSLRDLLPTTPLAACLSAAHLAAFRPPAHVRRLVIARDNGEAGRRAARRLAERMRARGVVVIVLRPILSDFNADRQQLGVDQLRENITRTVAQQDHAS